MVWLLCGEEVESEDNLIEVPPSIETFVISSLQIVMVLILVT